MLVQFTDFELYMLVMSIIITGFWHIIFISAYGEEYEFESSRVFIVVTCTVIVYLASILLYSKVAIDGRPHFPNTLLITGKFAYLLGFTLELVSMAISYRHEDNKSSKLVRIDVILEVIIFVAIFILVISQTQLISHVFANSVGRISSDMIKQSALPAISAIIGARTLHISAKLSSHYTWVDY